MKNKKPAHKRGGLSKQAMVKRPSTSPTRRARIHPVSLGGAGEVCGGKLDGEGHDGRSVGRWVGSVKPDLG